MRAFASVSGGVCVIRESGEDLFFDVVAKSVIPSEISHLVCGCIDDWEVLEKPDRQSVVDEVLSRYQVARVVSNVEVCLLGVSSSLVEGLLKEVEEYLLINEIYKQAYRRMLVAPFVSEDSLVANARVCVSFGLALTAGLLDSVRESQPLIRRLADIWLSIDEELFAAFSEGRQFVWRLATDSGVVASTLDATTRRSIENAWQGLVYSLVSTQERVAISRISRAVASSLFPCTESESDENISLEESYDEYSGKPQARRPRFNAKQGLEWAKNQVIAVSAEVAVGNDSRAKLYLDDLLEVQLGYEGGAQYAVKSLCNIASQCADMYRTDFEYYCLSKAIEVAPGDGWAHVQMADHLKRVGQYEKAIELLQEAERLGEWEVAKSSLADVYSQLRRHQDAIDIYDKCLSTNPLNAVVRQARADVLRHWGRYDEASKEYEQLVVEGLASHRTYAGKAEIAKRSGRLSEAIGLYESLVGAKDLDATSLFVYKTSLANVYLRYGRLEDAYRVADAVVQARPFARHAKAFRAAVAGLLGRGWTAVLELQPVSFAKSRDEVVNEFVRGLLLLMLDRYSEARVALIDNVGRGFVDDDCKGVVALAAVACLLQHRSGVEEASSILFGVPDLKDVFANAVRKALELHVAVSLRRESEIEAIVHEIEMAQDGELNSLVLAIKARDWSRASSLEIRSLLRLTA